MCESWKSLVGGASYSLIPIVSYSGKCRMGGMIGRSVVMKGESF